MVLIDQNKALSAQQQALIPASTLIDGRTENDRLSFLTEYSRLINFYDGNNALNGNWEPFLLKDPVFLLATISKAKVARYEAPFKNAVQGLHNILFTNVSDVNETVLLAKLPEISRCFNSMFNQLTYVFMHIEHWTRFMLLSDEAYDLKSYLLEQIKTNYAPMLWALLSFREYIWRTNAIEGVERVQYYLFDNYDQRIWQQSKNNSPFWEVLGITAMETETGEVWLEYPLENLIKKSLVGGILNISLATLINTGDAVFNFYKAIIANAPVELERQKLKRSNYPDTTLLRAFVNILQVQQEQLNTISKKHLSFYYKDILKQSEKGAQADSTFLYCTLAKQDAVFNLPAGTLFSAGLDAQKKAVNFLNTQNVSLNPAQISKVYTLTAIPSQEDAFVASLYLNSIDKPGAIKSDESGKILGWPTFGGNPAATAVPLKTGMAFASPMLLLREGLRYIFLTLTFSTAVKEELFTNATCYLSTQKKWLPVNVQQVSILANGDVPASSNLIKFLITLTADDPAIEAFLQNPDGLESVWPMLKLEFSQLVLPQNSEPVIVTALKIETRVSGVKNLNLYNDFGELSTKNAYPPFGTLPLKHSNFIIGSNEIFSKPFQSLYLTLDWENLPGDFLNYYQQYNNYVAANPKAFGEAIAPEKTVVPASVDQAQRLAAINASSNKFVKYLQTISLSIKNAVAKLLAGIKGLFGLIWKVIKGLVQFFVGIIKALVTTFVKILASIIKSGNSWPIVVNSSFPFNNTAFTVDFFLLQQKNWLPFTWSNVVNITVQPNAITSVPYVTDIKCVFTPVEKNLLFTTNSNCVITNQSSFAYNIGVIVPANENPPTPNGPTVQQANTLLADAYIQTSDLKFTDTSSSGFMKMSLLGPLEGFGSGIFSNVVSWVALNNAKSLSSFWIKGPITQPPNAPFVPKLKSITADYESAYQYIFTEPTQDYPFQAFLYTPFENFLIYDNTLNSTHYATTVNTNLCGISNAPFLKGNSHTTELKTVGLPLCPEFDYQGALFIGLTGLLAPAELNLYFEIAAAYKTTVNTVPPDFYYLSQTGWQTLNVLMDTTNGLNCSGILTVNVPDTISTSNFSMERGMSWIAIATNGNALNYSQVILLNSNGFVVQRNSPVNSESNEAPVIKAGTITQPQTAVPQIATTTQPFNSFGGKAAENETQMNERVSLRIKTKDRVLTQSDFFALVNENYPFVYYSDTRFDKHALTAQVYVVRRVNHWKDAAAFAPLVSDCELFDISDFLQKRTSFFVIPQAMNYQLIELTLTVNKVVAKRGYETEALKLSIAQAFAVYVSPWIKSNQKQIPINNGVSVTGVTNFIAGLEGVKEVSGVSLTLAGHNSRTQSDGDVLLPERGYLMVPAKSQNITVKQSND